MFSKFTINSAVFLGLTIFTVSAATALRNPLLVYTAIFLVTANVVLYIWAQNAVRGLAIKREHPRLAVATKPARASLLLTNNRRTSRYGILGFDLHPEVSPGKDYTPVAFLEAPRHTATKAEYEFVPARRGVFEMGPFYLYGGDPFGFYKCWRKYDEFTEITVLPCPLSFKFVSLASTSAIPQDEVETLPVAGESTEFLGVREYVSGEPMRKVHWRTTARMGKLISRQYEMNVAASISTMIIADDGMLNGGKVDNPLEYSLTMIASLGQATCTERFKLNYLALSGDAHDSFSGTGRQFYQELAVRLAKLKCGGSADWDNRSRLILNYLPRGSSLIVFTAELKEATRYRLRQLAARFRSLQVVSFNQESFIKKQHPVTPGPRLSFGENYLIFEVSYGDNLSYVLDQLMAKSTLGGVRK